MSARPRFAVIGAGYMGCNHARVISENEGAELSVVIDSDRERAEALAREMGCDAATDPEAAVGLDAVVVASATEAHLECTLPLLEAQVPVLIEKPLSSAVDEVVQIVAAAERTDTPVLCGFVERFNPVITTAIDLLPEEVIHLVAIRHSPAAPRILASVVWDLLIHDIDLSIEFSGGSEPEVASGSAWAPPGHPVAEIADCTLQFANGMVGSLSTSRASQRKVRQMYVNTGSTLVELDLLRQDITVYRNVRQEQFVGHAITYRAETIVDIPFVRHGGEPLALQFKHFLGMVNGEGDVAHERSRLLTPHRIAAELIAREQRMLATARR